MLGVGELLQILESGACDISSAASLEIEGVSGELVGHYAAYQGQKNPDWIFIKKVEEPSHDGSSRLFSWSGSSLFRRTKFHVTLPDDDKLSPESNFAKALPLVTCILFQRRIRSFKVLLPTIHLEAVCPQQRGKTITIFASGNPELNREDWVSILTEIDATLKTSGIKPGPRPVTDPDYDRAETGVITPFVSYRVTEGIDPMRNDKPATMMQFTA